MTEDLKHRFKCFAIDVAVFLKYLPVNAINTPYSRQLIRSSSSSGANYRAACRAKSTADFIHKLKIVEEELDESLYFLELIQYFNPEDASRINDLMKEGGALLAIIVSSIKTARSKSKSTRS